MAYTTQNLLDAIARKSFAPTGQVTFQDADLLAIADEELESLILPALLKVREEYFLTHKDYTLTAGTAGYRVPPRSIGLTVREVSLVNSNGSVINPSLIMIEDIQETTQQGTPSSFYIKGNDIVLYPTPNSADLTLRVHFQIAPGQHIPTTDAAVISGINTTTNVVSVSSIPATWVTGDIFDFVSKEGGHEYKDFDKTSILVSGTDITFSSLPSSLVTGDYVAPQGQSPLVQLPAPFRTVLVQAVVASIQRAMSLPGASASEEKLMALLQSATDLVSPRVIGEAKVFLPPSWM
jgi:hypothetical protein